VTAQIGEAQTDDTGVDAHRHTVTGMVINSVTGTPIARALVDLDMQNTRHAMTDGNGVFGFEGVPEGAATLEAERPGFFTQSDGTPMGIQVAGDMDGIVLKLVPEAQMEGYVRSIQGTPIEGFPVRLYRRNVVDGSVQWELLVEVNSREDGHFRVFRMPAESVIVSVGPEYWRSRPPKGKRLGYPLAFYPNGRDFSAANVISVSPGQQLEVDFSLNQEPLFEISGEIIGVPRTVDAKIELSNSSCESLPLVQPHPGQHDFSAYVTEGKYTLRASAEVEGQTLQATVPLNISSDTSGIQVLLKERPAIPVKVLTDFDTGHNQVVSSARVTLVSKNASLGHVKFIARRGQNADQTVMNITGVEPGNYSVEISPYGAYVKSATSATTNVLQDDFLVPENGTVAPIEIVLSNDGGTLKGNVKLPDQSSPATILLVPGHESAKEIRTTMTAAGQFEFEQVRPGDYVLLAFSSVDGLEYRNPDVLSSYLSRGTHVSVQPSQAVTATLTPISLDN
jgi:hypothetical protein